MLNELQENSLKTAANYHYGKFPPTELDYNLLFEPMARATDAIARFDQMLKNLHNSEILLAPLRNQEAVISSRMEGTISTMDEILQYEADLEENGPIENNAKSEIIETFLYQQTLKNGQHALEGGAPLNEWLLRALHEGLLSFGRGASKNPGRYKIRQNYIGEQSRINFIPISPEKLQDGLDNLFSFLGENDMQILLKIGMAHVEFEALHPFQDGNGRVGRMLITLMLWHYEVISAPHFYVSASIEGVKDEYIETMRKVSVEGNWTAWAMFFLKILELQARRNLKIAEDISRLYESLKPIFTTTLRSQWSSHALDYLFAYPVFRNSSFVSRSEIPVPTARRFSKILLENNLLKVVQESSGPRAAMYSFEPLMKLVRV